MKPRNFPDRVNQRRRAALLRAGKDDSHLLLTLRDIRTKKRRAAPAKGRTV